MRTFLVFLAAYVFSQFYRAFLAVVAVDLGRDLGFGPGDLGDISAAWFVACAVTQLPVGYALDRWGPRRTVSGFMLAAALGAALFAAGSSYGTMMVAMALIGVGCAPVLMGALYIFGQSFDVRRFAVLTSALVALGNIGNLLAATPLALAAHAFGWRHAMAGISALTLVAALLVFVLIRDPARPRRTEAGGGAGEIFSLLADRGLWPIFVMSCISYAVIACERGLWIGPYLDAVYGLGAVERGNAALAMGLAMTAGSMLLLPLERRFGGPRRVVLMSGVITAGGFLALAALPAAPAGSATVLVAIGLLALVGGIGMSYALLMTHGRQFYPPHLLGRGVTAQNFLFIGGASVMQSLSGHFVTAASQAGMAPAASYSRLHLAFGLALLAATAVYAFSRERRLSPA